MDVLTFISELIKAVAWPATAIVLVVLLRKPIVELIPLLRKLKYKEIELEFAQEVYELKAEVEAIAKEKGEEAPSIASTSSNLLNLVTFSTRAAIMEAWLEVESASVTVASSFWGGPPNETFRNMPRLGEYLLQCKVIDEKQLSVFNKLRQLRNKAAHAQELDLSENDARSYVQLASDLAKHIREA
ncbi:hypothetical protein [Aeromonas caviae]|uniref:DUF4145 domain-containing protein n=1 Tax=Aeromonas caviae TaxID=648 RepID=A0AAF0GFE6_AERCA|nr:hypothetical protein [Aeromonas caviae]WGC86180.1 hypothetical protein OJY61_23150 [Aeromonas caviae]BBG89074.1 hypothetical protein ACGSH8M1_017400 [Aeromonas caviae]BBT52744.1 hypothetical protein WP8S18C01_17070 [Aeromonas caviae]